jgi:trehalose 6-phosphate phosphatase
MLETTDTGRVEAALRAVVGVLKSRPAALITDIDGTISRIVTRPEDALVSERARQALLRLAEEIDLVAVVTAREVEVARRLVGLDGLTYVGNYGLQGVTIEGADLASVRDLARDLTRLFPCVTFEEKGVSFALHYRNCEDPEVKRLALLGALTPATSAAGGRLLEGKMVLEVVPGGLPDKATAVTRLVTEQGASGVVYLGDDLSDVVVFNEIANRRTKGLPGIAIAVIDGETDASVAASADLKLNGVSEVEELLERLDGELGGRSEL